MHAACTRLFVNLFQFNCGLLPPRGHPRRLRGGRKRCTRAPGVAMFWRARRAITLFTVAGYCPFCRKRGGVVGKLAAVLLAVVANVLPSVRISNFTYHCFNLAVAVLIITVSATIFFNKGGALPQHPYYFRNTTARPRQCPIRARLSL